jgi:hypothetical protein
MRVQNPTIRNDSAHGPFQPVQFDGNGISEEVPVDVVHYLCRFPGYRPYKGPVTQAAPQVPDEPTDKATKQEILSFCQRWNVGGVSEEMTKRQLLDRIHEVFLERQGAGRILQKPKPKEAPDTEETEDEGLFDTGAEEVETEE